MAADGASKKDKKKAKKAAEPEEAEAEVKSTKRKKAQAEAEETAPKKRQKKVEESPEASKEVKDADGRKLYVGGFSKNTSEEVLREKFLQYGKVEDISIPHGKGAKRICFVIFKKKAAAEAALEEDGEELDGSKLKVRMADGTSTKTAATTAVAAQGHADTAVFVAGLGLDCSEASLLKKLSKCGEVEKLDVPVSKGAATKGQSRGFAIAKFKKKAGADAALKLDGVEFQGKKLNVRLYTSSATDSKKVEKQKSQKAKAEAEELKKKEFRVFVGGFQKSTTEALLREHFEPCGEVKHVLIPKNKDGVPRGIAFINFGDKAAMKEALRLNGQEFREKPLKVADAAVTSKKGKNGAKQEKRAADE